MQIRDHLISVSWCIYAPDAGPGKKVNKRQTFVNSRFSFSSHIYRVSRFEDVNMGQVHTMIIFLLLGRLYPNIRQHPHSHRSSVSQKSPSPPCINSNSNHSSTFLQDYAAFWCLCLRIQQCHPNEKKNSALKGSSTSHVIYIASRCVNHFAWLRHLIYYKVELGMSHIMKPTISAGWVTDHLWNVSISYASFWKLYQV